MEYSPDLVATIIASPGYKEHCALLYELFEKSRHTNSDPLRILEVQEGICFFLDMYQAKKTEFRKSNDVEREALASRLILILKQIADSMVWRVFNYDRVLIQQLAEHPQTGAIDDTTFGDMIHARKIVEERGEIVFVNDLTNVLRHGDLTILGRNENYIMETKYGKGSAKAGRAKQQKKRLKELFDFLNFGVRTRNSERVFVFRAKNEINTYHETLQMAVNEVKQKGYYQADINDCLNVYLAHMDLLTDEFPNPHNQWSKPHLVSLTNWRSFFKPTPRAVPYGNFPLDDRDCFDLMTGHLHISSALNFDMLQLRFKQAGLELELPNPSQDEIDFYLQADIASRKKVMYEHSFLLRSDTFQMKLTPDYFGRMALELLDIDSFIEAEKEMVSLIKNIDIPDGIRTFFYTGYKLESKIWK